MDIDIEVVTNEIEEAIEEKCSAPRVTKEQVESKVIHTQYHVFKDTCLTTCCLTLENGHTVTGESACASPENFDKDIGMMIAKRNAMDNVWPLEGYLLSESIYRDKFNFTDEIDIPLWFRAAQHRPVIGEFVWVYMKETAMLAAIAWDETLENSTDFEGIYWQPVDAPKLPEFDELDSE